MIALAAAAQACAAEGDIVLSLDDSGCSAGELSAVSVVAVDVYGTDDDGALCILAKRCIFDVDQPTGAGDIAEALRGAEPPLVDVDAEGARWLAIVGHEQSCWGERDQVACGFADFADSSGGELEMTLQCGGCDEGTIPFCP